MSRLRQLAGPMPFLAVGLMFISVAGYGFVVGVNHSFKHGDPADNTALLSLYFLINIVGLGVFAGLEQETTRSVSQTLARGESVWPAVRHAGRQAVVLSAGAVVLLAVLSPFLVSRTLNGSWILFAEAVIGVFCAAGTYLVRGVLAGHQKFTPYAWTMVVEGVAKLLPIAALALAGVHSVWPYGLAFALGQGFCALVGLAFAVRILGPRPKDWAAEIAAESAPRGSAGLAMLVGASFIGQSVANLVPLVVNARSHGSADLEVLASTIGTAITLVRMPTLLFVPIQSIMLPSMTAAATRGEYGFVRQRTRQLIAAGALIGLLGVLGFAGLGPWALRDVMGAGAALSGLTVGTLALGTLFLLEANVMAPALVALGRQGTVLVAWAIGFAGMAVTFVLPLSVERMAVAATVVGPAVVAGVMVLGVLKYTRLAAAEPAEPPLLKVASKG